MDDSASICSGSLWSLSDGEYDSEGYSVDDASSDGVGSERVSGEETSQFTVAGSILPCELLQLIFDYAYQLEQDWSGLALRLSQVCRFWRFVALSHPVLWSTIDILKDPQLIELFLERSKSAKLNVRMCLNPLVTKDGGRTRIAQFSNLLARHVERVQTVVLHVYYAIWISASRTILGNPDQVAHIDVLDIKLLQYNSEEIAADTNPEEVCQQFNCQPRKLMIEDFVCSNTKFFSISLRSLSLCWLPSRHQVRMIELIPLLAECPNLEELQLDRCTTTYFTGTIQAPAVQLIHLKTIHFAHLAPSDLILFFDHIITPNLHSITFEPIGPGREIIHLASITAKLASVAHFHLKAFRLSPSYVVHLQNFLCDLPHLSELQFSTCYIAWHHLDWLIDHPEKGPPPCPNLTKLTLAYDYCVTHDILIRIIESRTRKNGRVVPFTSLICKAPLASTFDPAALVDALQDKVPTLVLEVLPEPRAVLKTESDVEEEWYHSDEGLDLDSGDEAVLAMRDQIIVPKMAF